MKVMPGYVELMHCRRFGLLFTLVVLGQAAVVHAQGVGVATGRTSATTARSANRPYNRVTTGRQDVVATSSRTSRAGDLGRLGAGRRRRFAPSLFGSVLSSQSGSANSEIPWSSTQQPRPQTEPVMVRSAPHNYYPSMRTAQHLNANTAQITRGRMGVPHICVPSRGASLAGGMRGR